MNPEYLTKYKVPPAVYQKKYDKRKLSKEDFIFEDSNSQDQSIAMILIEVRKKLKETTEENADLKKIIKDLKEELADIKIELETIKALSEE